MKNCLKCGESYSDMSLNFCLNDGELLVQETYRPPPTQFADDSPPTLVINQPRLTTPIDFSHSSQIPWQSTVPQAVDGRLNLGGYAGSRDHTPDQTLPIISLVLGVISCFLVCCAGGILFGLPAAFVGFLAMRNAERDPTRYSGRGLAIAGMVLGIVTFFASLFFLIFGKLS